MIAFSILALLASVALADLATFRFSALYGDGMVLQRNSPAPVWGFGKVGASVKVSLDGTVVGSSTVASDGTWSVDLGEHDGSPSNHSVIATSSSGEQIVLYDVLFGEVVLGSGQSNMEFGVAESFSATEEEALSKNFDLVRVFIVNPCNTTEPLPDVGMVWEFWTRASPDAIGRGWGYLSAVSWGFGRRLQAKLGNVPVGIIQSAYGGTIIQSWSPPAVVSKCSSSSASTDAIVPSFLMETEQAISDDPIPPPPPPTPTLPNNFTCWKPPASVRPNGNSVLWNAMISPLTRTAIGGALWFQGESNSGNPDSYLCYLQSMVAAWRAAWKPSPNFYFGVAQLGADGTDLTVTGGFPAIRWHQTADMYMLPNEKIPNSFLGVNMDLSDPTSPYGSVHFRNKSAVSERLFLAYQHAILKDDSVIGYAPLIKSVSKQGQAVTIQFDTSKEDITVRNSTGFSVTGPGCLNGTDTEPWSQAPITSSTSTSVTIQAPSGCNPTQLRYAWKTRPCIAHECAIYGATSALPSPPYTGPIQ